MWFVNNVRKLMPGGGTAIDAEQSPRRQRVQLSQHRAVEAVKMTRSDAEVDTKLPLGGAGAILEASEGEKQRRR